MFDYANMTEDSETYGPVRYTSAAASVEPVGKTFLCERFHIVDVTKCALSLFAMQNCTFRLYLRLRLGALFFFLLLAAYYAGAMTNTATHIIVVKPSAFDAYENATASEMLETRTNATEEETSEEYDYDYDDGFSASNTTHKSWQVEIHHVSSFIKVCFY